MFKVPTLKAIRKHGIFSPIADPRVRVATKAAYVGAYVAVCTYNGVVYGRKLRQQKMMEYISNAEACYTEALRWSTINQAQSMMNLDSAQRWLEKAKKLNF